MAYLPRRSFFCASSKLLALGKNALDDFPMDIRKSVPATLMFKRQTLVINAEQVK